MMRKRWRAPTLPILILAAIAFVVTCHPAEAGWLGKRITNSVGKVISIERASGSKAKVIVYANFVEADGTCYILGDIARVHRNLRVGDSLGVLGSDEIDGSGCVETRYWRRIGRSPKAEAMVAIRHDIAVWMFGIDHPHAMAEFIGTGENNLSKAELEKLAARVPDLIHAFGVWGIDLRDYSGSNERIRELEAENEALAEALAVSRTVARAPVAVGADCEKAVDHLVAEIRRARTLLDSMLTMDGHVHHGASHVHVDDVKGKAEQLLRILSEAID